MHLRLRVLGEHASSEDVVISCTPSVSVSEVARALQHRCDRRAGQDRSAVTHRGPVTLVGRPVDGNDAHVIDPGAALESSGIQSGWEVRILAPCLEHQRLILTILQDISQHARMKRSKVWHAPGKGLRFKCTMAPAGCGS